MLTECPQESLEGIVAGLLAAGDRPGPDQVAALLEHHPLSMADVHPYVLPGTRTYTRRRVARTDAFEVLVMTWLPGQGTAPHDHAGSTCGFRVIQGVATETLYSTGADGLAEPTAGRQLQAGQLVVQAGPGIHSICNAADSDETLVTVHVYAPPLPELRRFAPCRAERRPAAFIRRPGAGAHTVAVIGGGFSGTMVAAQLLRQAGSAPLHVVLFDRQAAIGEGPAYRTPDAAHLLNVPASGMSAWPDEPGHFLKWARSRAIPVAPYDFLPRQTFGEYVRTTFLDEASASGPDVSTEICRSEVTRVHRLTGGGWAIGTADGREMPASAIVLATGHAAPDDPLGRKWFGSRARYIADPWSSLALSSIGPDETVLLIGTGLTAVDVALSLTANGRRAPIIGVSRRGLAPAAHAPEALPPLDPSRWLDPLLRAPAVAMLDLLRAIRRAVRRAEARGEDWRQVIDGLRPHTARIWRALPAEEARRFLRHARVYWDAHRHRMAPEVGDRIAELTSADIYRTLPGRILDARGALDGVSVAVNPRGNSAKLTLNCDWVINCTGPGPVAGRSPVIASLVGDGNVELDPIGLGLVSTPDGRALAAGRAQDDLLVVGTLRRASLWESTAVPELRQQAAATAAALLERLRAR